MGSKGSKPAQSNTTQLQTYKPDSGVSEAGRGALDMAQAAASQPFQTPVAPVAGFNPFQQQAFSQIQGMQGQYQPYIDAASQYYQSGAAPITGADVANYYNPMADKVFAQLQDTQNQQMHQVTGNLTQAAGGIGASRIAVGQGVLANQQDLAKGQVSAQLWQQALQAAQQGKQNQFAGAAGMLGTGAANQAAGYRDIAALGQAGLQQQQQTQAELNAPYQNELQRLAYPFQTAQYLAGITSGVAPALGGSTYGQSQSTYTPAQPSGLQQGIGLGMQGLGLAMGMPGISMAGSGVKGAGSGATYGVPAGQSGMASFGGVPYPVFAAGGAVDDGPTFPVMPQSSIVPGIRLQPGAGRSSGSAMVGAMKMAQPKMGDEQGQKPQTNAGAASGALQQLGGLTANKEAYEPDDPDEHADGGAVFPKHFYDSGGAIDDTPIMDDWGDPTGGGAANAFPVPKSRGATWGFDEVPATPAPAPANDKPLLERVFGPRSEWEKPSTINTEGWGDPTGGGAANAFPIPSDPRLSRAAGASQLASGAMDVGQQDPEILRRRAAIRGNEGNVAYDQLHPAAPNGDQAIGPYGIMSRNVADFTTRTFGKPMSVQEFRNNPAAQDQVFDTIFGRLAAKYGAEGAARAWFAGEGGMNDMGRSDGSNNVAWYDRNFRQRYGSGDNVEVSAAGRPNMAVTGPGEPGEANRTRFGMPRSMMPYPDATSRDWGQQMSRSPWMNLVKAGAAVANSPGRLGAAVAKGLGTFAEGLDSQRKDLRAEEVINQRSQQLYQTAQHYLDQYNRMTPYQREQVEHQRRMEEQGKYTPFNYVDADGKPQIGFANTKDGKFYDLTGKQIENATGLSRASGSGAGGQTAMIKNIEYMVNNGMAPDKNAAYSLIKQASRSQYERANVVNRFLKTLQADPNNVGTNIDVLRKKAESMVDGLIQADKSGGLSKATEKPPLTPQQEGALKFIQENPNDPRVPAMKKKLKEEGVE